MLCDVLLELAMRPSESITIGSKKHNNGTADTYGHEDTAIKFSGPFSVPDNNRLYTLGSFGVESYYTKCIHRGLAAPNGLHAVTCSPNTTSNQ